MTGPTRVAATARSAGCAFVLLVCCVLHAHGQLPVGLTAGSTLSPVLTASAQADGGSAATGAAGRAGGSRHISVPVAIEAVPSWAEAQDPADTRHRMVAGGIAGGLIGLVLGGAMGFGLEQMLATSCFDYCGLGGAALGGVIGESLGLAYGVHVGNHRRGSYSAAVVGPVGIVVGSLALGMLLEDVSIPPALILAGVPVLQLYTSMKGEQAATRRRTAPP